MTASLEHLNITVRNPEETAARLGRLFGWHVRWSGPSMLGGNTVHVGTEDQYIAVYTTGSRGATSSTSRGTIGRLNHVGVVVDDLEAVEQLVTAEGLTPHNHDDYEPGRRFYFDDPDDIEFEVVTYQEARQASASGSGSSKRAVAMRF